MVAMLNPWCTGLIGRIQGFIDATKRFRDARARDPKWSAYRLM